jgi:hypothetical protein
MTIDEIKTTLGISELPETVDVSLLDTMPDFVKMRYVVSNM